MKKPPTECPSCGDQLRNIGGELDGRIYFRCSRDDCLFNETWWPQPPKPVVDRNETCCFCGEKVLSDNRRVFGQVLNGGIDREYSKYPTLRRTVEGAKPSIIAHNVCGLPEEMDVEGKLKHPKYILRSEPEPDPNYSKTGKLWRAFEEDGTPLYMGADSAEKLQARVREFWPGAVFQVEEGPSPSTASGSSADP